MTFIHMVLSWTGIGVVDIVSAGLLLLLVWLAVTLWNI